MINLDYIRAYIRTTRFGDFLRRTSLISKGWKQLPLGTDPKVRYYVKLFSPNLTAVCITIQSAEEMERNHGTGWSPSIAKQVNRTNGK